MTANEINRKTVEVAQRLNGINIYEAIQILNQAVTMIERSVIIDKDSKSFLKIEDELNQTY